MVINRWWVLWLNGVYIYKCYIIASVTRIWYYPNVNGRFAVPLLYRRFPDNHFPGQTFPGQDLSRTRPFPDSHFPGQTFPGQVILRNFQVHNVCKYQLYRPSQTICMYTERLLMCACNTALSIWGLFGKSHHITSHWDDRCRPRRPLYPRNKCLSYEFVIHKIANIQHYI